MHLFPALGLCAAIAGSCLPATAGPKQEAAKNACHQTYQEQTRSCQMTNNPSACMTMYTDKLEECLAKAETVAELKPGSPPERKPKLQRVAPAGNLSVK